MGRHRKYHNSIPAHIDQTRLPDGIIWDSSGKGHWYEHYRDSEGKRRRRKVAGPEASLGDLHKAKEQQTAYGRKTLDYLATKFHDSLDFEGLSSDTQSSYENSRNTICTFPTKSGRPLGGEPLPGWSGRMLQRVIDRIGEKRGPTAAKHVKQYLSRLFNWGKNRGYCEINHTTGIQLPKERKRNTMPTILAYSKALEFARERAQRKSRTKGSISPTILPVLEIAYKCRLRGIEVLSLTDAHITKVGIDCQRRKGSNDNITKYDDRLKAAVDYAQAHRSSVYDRSGLASPIRPEHRPLIVNDSGRALTSSSWQSNWRRFMALCIKEGVIEESERFTLHGMKHRGVTDTKGTKADKQLATGHKSMAMVDIYDHDKPVVKPAGE